VGSMAIGAVMTEMLRRDGGRLGPPGSGAP
jgi:hypothetical protein